MSNGKSAVSVCIEIARCFKLWAKISMMIVDGKRNATSVANVLQGILDSSLVWKTWKTIKLGCGLQTADDFHKAIKKAGMRFDDLINSILDNPAFTIATSEVEVELVIASVAELGFKQDASLAEIYVRAQEFGLDLCPPEVGTQLRLQYTDQPKGEWLVIAMEPITGFGGYRRLFSIGCDDDSCFLGVCGGYACRARVWDTSTRFIFLHRK